MFCSKCGAQLPDGSKFCTKCGAQLNAPAARFGTAAPQPSAAVPGHVPASPALHIPSAPISAGATLSAMQSSEMMRFVPALLVVLALALGLLTPCVKVNATAQATTSWGAGLANLSNQLGGTNYDAKSLALKSEYSLLSIGEGLDTASSYRGFDYENMRAYASTTYDIEFKIAAAAVGILSALGIARFLAQGRGGLLAGMAVIDALWIACAMGLAGNSSGLTGQGNAVFTVEAGLPLLACALLAVAAFLLFRSARKPAQAVSYFD